MIIGGLEKLSLIDYPGEVAAVVFTQGCNFRCPFCHNPMLVQASKKEAGKIKNTSQFWEGSKGHSYIGKNDLLDFLKKRFGKLDGVVVTGGEPTIHPDLESFLQEIKAIGYKIKLDTNGTKPDVLEKVIKSGKVDYLAMDFKGAPSKYHLITRVNQGFSKIRKSVKIIMTSKLPYEFRTTLVPGLIDKKDLEKIGFEIKGADHWFLQRFINYTSLLDSSFESRKPFSEKEIEIMHKIAQKYVKNAQTR